MRTCPSCGLSIPSDTARFCGSCGARVEPVGEIPTVMERIPRPGQQPAAGPPPPPPPPPPSGLQQQQPSEALQFTAVCPSCGAANPPDTSICEFCGEEIPVDQRRRRTAVFGALGAGGAGVAGGAMLGREGSGALEGMARGGEAMRGLGQGGQGMQGLGQGGQGLQGLGQAPGQGMGGLGQGGGQAMPGLGSGGAGSGAGAAGPSNLGVPPSPGAGPAGMGSGGAAPPSVGPGSPGGGPLGQPPPSPGGAPPAGPMGNVPPPASVAQPSPPSWPVPGAGEAVSGGTNIGGTIVKVVLGGIGIIGGVGVGAIVLLGILLFTGDPKPCVERSPAGSDGAVTALFDRWNTFRGEAQSGPATVTFSEDEATSRALQYINEKDIALKDAQVFFCPNGRGQLKGSVSALGRDMKVLLEGRVDASQEPAVIVVDRIDAGNVPGWVLDVVKGVVEDQLDKNDAKTLDFGIPISAVNVTDSQVTLESPGP